MTKKECEQFEEMLVDYADGAVPGEQARQVASHLEQCAQCRTKIEALRRSLDLARTVWQANLGNAGGRGKRCFWLARGLRKWPYAAAAAVLIIASLVLYQRPEAGPEASGLTAEQVEQQIMAEGSAARLLATAEILSRKPHAQELAESQYRYLLNHYPDTRAAAAARTKTQ